MNLYSLILQTLFVLCFNNILAEDKFYDHYFTTDSNGD